MRLRRALFPALAALGCVALIAGGCGDDTPEDSVAPQADEQATAESDARAGSSDTDLSLDDRDIAFAGGGSCFTEWTPADPAPEGVTLEGWANASFTKAEDEPVVLTALSAETGIDAAKIECFFAEAGEEPDPAASEAADGAAATGPGRSEPAPDGAAEPVGFGWCGAEWQPDLAPGTLPDGATMALNLNASFEPKELLEPARAAMAEASGLPADTIECNHEFPPIGECMVELGPGGDLPEGARVEGNIFGTYIRPADKNRVKAAVAELASVDAGQVRCMDFEDEGFEGEPIPVEPNDAPASEPPDAAVSGPAPE